MEDQTMAKGGCFTIDQMGKLREIEKARLAQGESGLRDYVQGLISRLTSGGVAWNSIDDRFNQTKRLWDLGFGRELGKKSFEQYLKDIPEIPAGLKSDDLEFPLLVLVDPRLGIKKSCTFIGIQFEDTDEYLVSCDNRHATPQTPFWVRFHDGRKNRNHRPSDCRKECTGNTFAATAMVGVMAYCHHSDIVKENEHVLDLPGSVHHENRDYCASLEVFWGGWLSLRVYKDSTACSSYGSGGFRRE